MQEEMIQKTNDNSKMILSNIKSYESGTTSFAVTKSGEVYSWGLNSKGEAGLGTYGNSSWGRFLCINTNQNEH